MIVYSWWYIHSQVGLHMRFWSTLICSYLSVVTLQLSQFLLRVPFLPVSLWTINRPFLLCIAIFKEGRQLINVGLLWIQYSPWRKVLIFIISSALKTLLERCKGGVMILLTLIINFVNWVVHLLVDLLNPFILVRIELFPSSLQIDNNRIELLFCI